MKALSIAGLAGLASLGAQAQDATPPDLRTSLDPVVVTATRALTPTSTIRDTIVITRAQLDAAGGLSLGEVLQREAGIELRANGGPGQPQSLFIRGAGSQQTLVLVDGLRVGSATVGTTAIEQIPLDMIERIEVVKGPLSSLYGGDAMGGVIQVFTRNKNVPYAFANVSYGTDDDWRVSAGVTGSDDTTKFTLAGGYRSIDAPSATNSRAFGYNPDRDPYDDAYFNFHLSQKMWTGENLAIDAFTTNGHTHYDAGPGDDWNYHVLSGAKFSSTTSFSPQWLSTLSVGEGLDRLEDHGNFPDHFETRQFQATWLNEFPIEGGSYSLGAETLRQKVYSDSANPFTTDTRNTNSVFVGVNQLWQGQKYEASVRWDDDDQFGGHTTGSISWGADWPGVARFGLTYAKGFRAPTFYDLYGPTFPGYAPNPDLAPEETTSYEVSMKNLPGSSLQWRLSYYDNRFDNLIVYDFTQGTVLNVARARARGIEAVAETGWLGARWKAMFTAQQPKNEDTGAMLQGRAERFGTFEVSRGWGSITAGMTLLASSERFDSANEDPSTRLGGYTVVDARVRYAIDKNWSAQLTATNLFDKHYESVAGYNAPGRGVLFTVSFASF
ncbi:MAG TPA: TonB-dependent receptor [Usitatibacter sp.]